MLKIVVKDRKPKPVFPVYIPPKYVAPVYQQPKSTTPPANEGMWHEVNTRNEIIRKAYVACPFVKGQEVIPFNPEDETKHGCCTIIGICATYAEYGKDCEWPAHNNPLILTALTKNNETLFTTTNYFKAKV